MKLRESGEQNSAGPDAGQHVVDFLSKVNYSPVWTALLVFRAVNFPKDFSCARL